MQSAVDRLSSSNDWSRSHELARRQGTLPPTGLGLVVEWVARHQNELLAAWEQAQGGGKSVAIAPLD